MNTDINTTETETTLHASLCSALARGGAWYIYIYPNGTCRELNPWSDSTHIEATGARLLFSAEASNLTTQDIEEAKADKAARSEIADNLVQNYSLLDEAERLLMDMAE